MRASRSSGTLALSNPPGPLQRYALRHPAKKEPRRSGAKVSLRHAAGPPLQMVNCDPGIWLRVTPVLAPSAWPLALVRRQSPGWGNRDDGPSTIPSLHGASRLYVGPVPTKCPLMTRMVRVVISDPFGSRRIPAAAFRLIIFGLVGRLASRVLPRVAQREPAPSSSRSASVNISLAS
jgi:hypothetical protein